MHHSAPTSAELGFLPAMYSFSGPTSLPEFDLGPPNTTSHLRRATLSNRQVADGYFHSFIHSASTSQSVMLYLCYDCLFPLTVAGRLDV